VHLVVLGFVGPKELNRSFHGFSLVVSAASAADNDHWRRVCESNAGKKSEKGGSPQTVLGATELVRVQVDQHVKSAAVATLDGLDALWREIGGKVGGVFDVGRRRQTGFVESLDPLANVAQGGA